MTEPRPGGKRRAGPLRAVRGRAGLAWPGRRPSPSSGRCLRLLPPRGARFGAAVPGGDPAAGSGRAWASPSGRRLRVPAVGDRKSRRGAVSHRPAAALPVAAPVPPPRSPSFAAPPSLPPGPASGRPLARAAGPSPGLGRCGVPGGGLEVPAGASQLPSRGPKGVVIRVPLRCCCCCPVPSKMQCSLSASPPLTPFPPSSASRFPNHLEFFASAASERCVKLLGIGCPC